MQEVSGSIPDSGLDIFFSSFFFSSPRIPLLRGMLTTSTCRYILGSTHTVTRKMILGMHACITCKQAKRNETKRIGERTGISRQENISLVEKKERGEEGEKMIQSPEESRDSRVARVVGNMPALWQSPSPKAKPQYQEQKAQPTIPQLREGGRNQCQEGP